MLVHEILGKSKYLEATKTNVPSIVDHPIGFLMISHLILCQLVLYESLLNCLAGRVRPSSQATVFWR